MMEFRRDDSGTVSAMFEPVEVDLLRHVTSQLLQLLASVDTEDAAMLAQPAIHRLLPAAYPDDPEAAAEFRRFTADGLIEGKLANAGALLAALGDDEPFAASDPADASTDTGTGDSGLPVHDPLPVPIVLDEPQVQSWLRTLTDLRLVVADRLQIDSSGTPGLDDEDSRVVNDIYNWLGMVQESLVYAIDA
ncbi:DUF2017 domain-containing protein [Cryobacterium sp. 1639]|uniref:DUF2017 family protein n=1 Tax=Cryobacterium inferilacus TaxID=2866629 RepID=UPI001C72C7F2|nr:DUF2017 family protein [Cryobacterium sp. 1639]MBX0298739.1 DUF2017 domain-containing protein [Cryobacterium sp. 1639]